MAFREVDGCEKPGSAAPNNYDVPGNASKVAFFLTGINKCGSLIPPQKNESLKSEE
jgi:hypothetical protein